MKKTKNSIATLAEIQIVLKGKYDIGHIFSKIQSSFGDEIVEVTGISAEIDPEYFYDE